MRRILDFIERVAVTSGHLAGWLVPLMMILIVVEVFMRYVVHQPPMVADEFSAYLLVALAYIGMAYTWREGGHVRINILTQKLPPRAASWLRLFGILLALVFTWIMVQMSFEMTVYSFERNLKSSTWILTPLRWPYLTVFVGFALLFITILADLVRGVLRIRAGEHLERTPQ